MYFVECSIRIEPVYDGNSQLAKTHVLCVIVNNQELLRTRDFVHLFIIRLTDKCGAQEILKFNMHRNITELARYASGLSHGTTLVGVTKNLPTLSSSNTTLTILKKYLGVVVPPDKVRQFYGFVAVTGYKGVTKRNKGPQTNLNSTFIGETFVRHLSRWLTLLTFFPLLFYSK